MKIRAVRKAGLLMQVLQVHCLLLLAALSLAMPAQGGSAPGFAAEPGGQRTVRIGSSPGRHAWRLPAANPAAVDTPPAEDDLQSDITVNINRASASEIAAVLPGVGPVKAQRIVDWRDTNGPFTHIDQLLDVTGIGLHTLDNIRPYIRLDDPLSQAADSIEPSRESGKLLEQGLQQPIRRQRPWQHPSQDRNPGDDKVQGWPPDREQDPNSQVSRSRQTEDEIVAALRVVMRRIIDDRSDALSATE